MKPPESPSSSIYAPLVDLELHVETVSTTEGLTLQYVLNSPSGAVPGCFHRDGGTKPIGTEAVFGRQMQALYDQLEGLLRGVDIDGEKLIRDEVADELTSIGHQLYDRLFSDKLRADYKEFREKVDTWLIVSDDRWSIPWELISPFEPGFDDDHLCVRYQLSRWLANSTEPAGRVRTDRITSIGTGTRPGQVELPSARDEHKMLEDLWEADTESLPEATHDQLKRLLNRGELGLLHFVGHGEYSSEQPEESSITLSDRTFRARDLTGPLQLTLRASRPVVFFNACRVARQGWWLTGIGGWAQSWVRGCGCGAFVGPLWAVKDRAALRFADDIYQWLKSGRTFGESLQAARIQIRKEFPGNPTWAAYTGYFHPNGRLTARGFAENSSASEPGIPAEIRRNILDFSRLITEKTEEFVGREWLLERIDAFQKQNPRGYFFLRGDPGIGKSSLAAEIVRRQGCVHHFNIRAEGINRADDFLTNICAQLIATYGLPNISLPPETTRDGTFFKGLLEEVVRRHPDEKILIVVDALDEAITIREGVNPLYLPRILPKGVYIVATARRDTVLNADEVLPLDLDQDDEGNVADVRLFVQSHVDRDGIRAYILAQELTEARFVDQMEQKSQGNFMYLRYVLPEIENGAYQTRDFDTLPHGLEGYYQDHWKRMRSRDEDKWFTYQLPVLVALTVVKEPVSVDLMVDFSGVDRRRIRDILEEWNAFLYKREVEDEETESRQKRYRMYHDSFHDFIAAKEVVADERVDFTAAHGKIADALWQELYG